MAQLLRRLLPVLIPFAINWFRKRQQNKKLQGGTPGPTPGQSGGVFGQKPGEQNVSGPFQTGGQ